MKNLCMVLAMVCMMGCEEFGESTYYETCNPVSGILGGTVVGYKHGLVLVSTPTGSCTGFILNWDTVITAAHCVDDINGLKQGVAEITVMSYDPCDLETKIISSEPSKFWVYPDYRGSGDWGNDLAIIQSPVPWSDVVPGDFLSIWSDDLRSVKWVTLYGTGYTSNNKNNHAGILKKGNRELESFTEDALKVRAGVVRACHGDSGGPIFSKNSGDNLVIGLFTGMKLPPSHRYDNCGTYGYSQYGVRINKDKVDWIEVATNTTCYFSISEHGHGQRTCWEE